MTVADNTSRNQYTATSGQTVFAYTFEIVDKDHIVVLKNGVALSEGTDYAVANVGNDNGGNITLTSGATAGDIMTLYREMPYSRTQNYTNSGDFLASEVNSDFDELWLAGEQTDRAFSQSIRKPITDSDSISMELPEAATRANKFVKFDATGAVDVAGATVTVPAEDVSIDDAGNYYTSDNVEGALQEVGADLTANTTKLNTIETGADVTDTANVTAAGAVMDSELTNEAAVKALNQGVATTDSPTFAGLTVDAVTYTGTDGTDGQVLMTNGAGVAAFEDMPSSTYLDVTDFGATGDGTTDDTTSIQNAINHASTREIQTIFFPAGHYKYTTLRLYHDQTDNTAFQGTNVYVGDGTTDDFDFGWYIADEEDLTVTVEGVEQTLNTHYTVSGVGSDTGGTVTFTAGNIPSAPVGSTVTTHSGSIVGGVATREFSYNGTVVPDSSNVSVTVGGVTSTAFTVDIGKKLVVFNVGSEPPVGTDNVVITIQKTINIASNNRDGRFVFLGTGKLGLSDLKFLKTEPTRIYGSILESTSSGSGLIVEPGGAFSNTDARNFRGESMTFIADNTGYIVTSESCPGISFSNCSFKQFNTGGSGLKIRNAWFFTMDQCFIYGPSDTGEPAVNTGDGITGGTGYFAGLWNITNSLIDSFSNGVRWNEGTFVNVSVKNSAIQNCNNHGFYADGGTLQQLLFDNVYQENVGVRGRSFIKGDGSGSASAQIRNLRMTSSFMYGPYMTGPLVDLDSVDSINCEHLYVYRSRQTFLNVTDTKNNQISSGNLENCTFTTDEDVAKYYTNVNGSTTVFTGPYAQVASDLVVYVDDGSGANYTLTTNYTVSNLDNVDGATSTVTFNTAPVSGRSIKIIRPIVLLTGIMPSVDNVIYPTVDKGFYFTADPDGSTSRRQFIRLYDEANDLLPEYVDVKATTGIAKFGFGDTVVETITSSPYNIGGTAGRTYYDLTHTLAGGLAVYIPDTGEVNDGRLMIIKNNESSASGYPYILVYNNSDQSTAIAQLSPGQAGLFIMDKQDGNKFKYTGRTFTNDLEMADNHKISFGRSEDLQIFHQSSDSTNRLVSGSANFALPTADGTAGQSIITDGSGNLTFGTAAGTGITAVVQDTSPQLGGDLDLNGSDITGTGNINVTGTVTADGATIDGALYVNGSGINLDNAYGLSWGDGTAQIRGSGSSEAVELLTSSVVRLNADADGDISFYNSAGNQQAFFWDASTSRLGINNTNPDATLNIGDISATNATGQGRIKLEDTSGSLANEGGLEFATSAFGSGYGWKINSIDAGGGVHLAFGTRQNSTTWSEKMRIDSSGNLLVGPSGSPVVEVDVAGEDLKVIGTVPGLELVESDNGGSRVRYAVNNSGLFQSLYGADTSTFGSTTVQTRKSDGSDNQVIYTYDGGANDYHWWGTRGGGDRLVQIDSSGKFRVRGGDVSFFNDGVTSEAFFWDSSASSLGLGTTSPKVRLQSSGAGAANAPSLGSASSNAPLYLTNSDTAYGLVAGTSSADGHVWLQAQRTDGTATAYNITLNEAGGSVGIGTSNPANNGLHIEKSGTARLRLAQAGVRSWDMEATGGDWRLNNATNSSEAFRVDSSGNILFGATSTATTSYGAKVLKDNSASEIFAVHRQASDGSLIEFARGGAPVGRISANGGDLVIGSSASGHKGVRFGANYIAPVNTGSAFEDNTTDLGLPAVRFKDLHLSNSIALSNATTSSFLQVSSNILQFGTSSSDPVAFYANNTERMRITSAGSVEIKGNSGSLSHRFDYNENGGEIQLLDDAGAVGTLIDQAGNNTRILELVNGSNMQLGLGASNTTGDIIFMTAGLVPSSRFDSSGRLQVNKTGTQYTTPGVQLGNYNSNSVNDATQFCYDVSGGTNMYCTAPTSGAQISFYRQDTGAFMGQIVNGASNSVSYATSSDQRLKENIADADDAGSKVDAIQVRKFDWKADGSHQDYGMIAQELQTVAPEAVSTPENSDDMMGVDYSKLVPMLVKEIQSLRARVAQLEND